MDDEACDRAQEEMTQQARKSIEGMEVIGKKPIIEDCERFGVPGFCSAMESLKGEDNVCCDIDPVSPVKLTRNSQSLCPTFHKA